MRWRKSCQLLDEEDVSGACEKSKARGTATPEKKLSSVTELVKKKLHCQQKCHLQIQLHVQALQ
jgi:hypothetical protein